MALYKNNEDARIYVERFGRVLKKWGKPITKNRADRFVARVEPKYKKAIKNQQAYIHRCELQNKEIKIKEKFVFEIQNLEMLYKTFICAREMFEILNVNELTVQNYPYEYYPVEKCATELYSRNNENITELAM